jgi:hypothetical protein
VAGLADQHAVTGAQDGRRLIEDRLDDAGVLAVLCREVAGALARLYVAEPARAALGLRHDLVGDRQDVAVAEVVG